MNGGGKSSKMESMTGSKRAGMSKPQKVEGGSSGMKSFNGTKGKVGGKGGKGMHSINGQSPMKSDKLPGYKKMMSPYKPPMLSKPKASKLRESSVNARGAQGGLHKVHGG